MEVKGKKCQVDVLSELTCVQTVEGMGRIFCVAVSHDGQFIATAGQKSLSILDEDVVVIRVWVVMGSAAHQRMEMESNKAQPEPQPTNPPPPTSPHSHHLILHPTPYRTFSGHDNDITSLDWSKENFLLSASIDKTVRLWHLPSSLCLNHYPHPYAVTSIAFHPIHHSLFLSGSDDHHIRLWNIEQRRVVESSRADDAITALTFSPDGYTVVAGLYTGQCVFYRMSDLKYFKQGKDKEGKPVTGLEYSNDGQLLLVTTSDSRVRCYRTHDFRQVCTMMGMKNEGINDIKATFSEDERCVIMGSDDGEVAVWKMPPREKLLDSSSSSPFPIRVDAFEWFKAGDLPVTYALFLPRSLVAYSSAGEERRAPLRNVVLTTGEGEAMKLFANSCASPG